jgi:hypothetical protein
MVDEVPFLAIRVMKVMADRLRRETGVPARPLPLHRRSNQGLTQY